MESCILRGAAIASATNSAEPLSGRMGNAAKQKSDGQPWLEARLRRTHERQINEPLPLDMVEMLRRLDAKTGPDDTAA
jgi:hypothetical protein